MLGRGGTIHSFCAINSFSMSVWMVPPIASSGTPRDWATATYIASRTFAGALIVIEVVIRSSGRSRRSRSISTTVSTATPSRPTSPSERGWSES